MRQATDVGNLHDRANLRSLSRPPVWCTLVEREVSSCAVIVRDVAGEGTASVPLDDAVFERRLSHIAFLDRKSV
jgi:hypothetical protein